MNREVQADQSTPTPRADAARPVRADVLEKCARLLGWPSLWLDDATGAYWARYGLGWNEEIISQGDLLLATLNKAAELTPKGQAIGIVGSILDAMAHESAMARVDRRRPRFLDVAMVKFTQLEPPHED